LNNKKKKMEAKLCQSFQHWIAERLPQKQTLNVHLLSRASFT